MFIWGGKDLWGLLDIQNRVREFFFFWVKRHRSDFTQPRRLFHRETIYFPLFSPLCSRGARARIIFSLFPSVQSPNLCAIYRIFDSIIFPAIATSRLFLTFAVLPQKRKKGGGVGLRSSMGWDDMAVLGKGGG